MTYARRIHPLVLLLALAMVLASLPRFSQAQEPARLLITEVYYDTPGEDGQEEWVEITNLGAAPLNLDGFKIGDEEQPGGGEGMAHFPAGAVLQPQQVAVVAQTATGFRALFSVNPDFELQDSDAAVLNLLPYESWASGELALNNDGDEILVLDAQDTVVDAVSYGDSTIIMAPSVLDVLRGQSIERFQAHCDTNSAGDWRPQTLPAPGTVSSDEPCAETPRLGEELELTAIGEIQGSDDRSPLINETVTFEGIVTGLLEDRNARGAIFYTVFVQNSPGDDDGDRLSSDAIAVFHGVRRPPYLPGDMVRVTGQVTEFFGFTEIDDSGLHIELLGAGQALPPSLPLQPPEEPIEAYYESLEGMRVALPDAVVVGPTFSGCGFAVTRGAGPIRFIREQVEDTVEPIVPILHHSDVTCGAFPQVKVGDVVQGLEGPLIYHFDQFKIVNQFAEELAVTAAAMPPAPQKVTAGEGEVSIATFNVHDYFNTVNDTGSDAEPKMTAEELRLKQVKLTATISELLSCPTLLAVQEVENEALLQALAQQLELPCGFRYQVAHRESDDARGIDVALLVDPRRGQIQDISLHQRCSAITTDTAEISIDCPAGQDPLFSRPPLEVSLVLDGDVYVVVVNHFKSKREGEQETAARRLAQANAVAELVRLRLEDNRDARVIVLGDFNDYALSAPMAVLTSESADLVNTALQVPLEECYTYNFGGVSQLLDAVLVSPSLASQIVNSTIVHVNADFPAAWQFDTQTLFRSSDHDVPLIILRTRESPPSSPAAAPTVLGSPATTDAPKSGASPVVIGPESKPPAERWKPLSMAIPGAVLVLLFVGIIVYRRSH